MVRQYDFALSWDKNKCFFTGSLAADCRRKGLSFLWITIDTVDDVIRKLEKGRMRIGVLLDTEATYDIRGDVYARLAYAVKDAGGIVINDPDRTRFAVDKSVMHYELMNAGIETPYTVVIRNWEPRTFRLTEEEKKNLGIPFIIKPGCGWGHRGVVYNAAGTIREIARARNFDRGDNFLLQEKVYPLELNKKRAWFRVFHIFDKIIPCWWDDRTSNYGHVTGEEFEKYRLNTLVRYVTRIAKMTDMSWFSSEIALEKKKSRTRFVAIDYVNDQCDMEAKSESKDGVPDNIVKLTAYSLVHKAHQLIKKKKKKIPKQYTILLKGISGRKAVRGLGYAPELLAPHIPEPKKRKQ